MLANFYQLKLHIARLKFWNDLLLITFDTSFEQKVGPVYTASDPTRVFEDVADRTNFNDLQNIYLELNCRILDPMVMKLITMQRMQRILIYCMFLTALFDLSSLNVLLLQMVPKTLQLMVIMLRKFSLKLKFFTIKKLSKHG